MSIETVRADWVGDRMFLLRDRYLFPIIMTQPMGVNGADLLPLSLIGCTMWDVVEIALKQRQALTGLEVYADSTRDDDPPWRFRRIHIRYRFRGRNLDEDHLRHAVDLSEQKYCSIYATLRDVVELTNEIEIVDDESAADGG